MDSVQYLLSQSEKEYFSKKEQLKFYKKALKIANRVDNDSMQLVVRKKMRNYFFYEEDFESYIESNHKIILSAKRIEDSSSLAHAYNSLGYAYFFNEIKDSSYYYYLEAAKLFNAISNDKDLSYTLGNLAVLQLAGKDYYGADENAVKALGLVENVEETNEIQDHKWILYNTLASVANALGDNNQSLEYNDKALEVAKRMENDFNNGIYSLNNIAITKRKEGRYNEAQQIFRDILNTENLFIEDPTFYALILENLAFTNFLTGSYNKREIVKMFERSYSIADSLEDDITKTGTAISMAKFFNEINEKDKALKFAKNAYELSKRTEKNEIALESMMLLSELTDGIESKTYLKEHIKLTDSLLRVERNVRNKFARIELETDQLEAENEQISKENVYLIILSIGILLTAILIYVVVTQRARNRQLKLVQKQQKADEDIYNLMLGQQDKVEEARSKEKIRVSKELHDGVLGRLFGTRLSLDGINFKDGKEAMMTRANYIGQLKTIEEDIRKISHELNADFVAGSGFMDIVTELIENQTQAYGLNYNFNYTDDISWDLVSNKTKINIYRIVQESMQNIYKHAEAKKIEISFSLKKNVICLAIKDDGIGFDTTRSKRGIGIKNMTSRVEEINGTIDFTSQIGEGTEVYVKIPYRKIQNETY